jgi:deoxyribodipyrimidine photo-lyase
MSKAIVWFRRDLRVEDNPALAAALAGHDQVLCAYIHAPEEEAPWSPGGASRWWLHHSLEQLGMALARRGGGLHIRRGPSLRTLQDLLRDAAAVAVYWNRLYEPALARRDSAIERALRDDGVDTHSFNANLLVEPGSVRTGSGGPYKVFTPFWRNVRGQLLAQPPQPAPARVPAPALDGSAHLDALRLLPVVPWGDGFHRYWQPGEDGARRALRRFCDEALAGYEQGRDRPDCDFTSRLSPHLHFGEIGPRQIVWALEELRRDGSEARDSAIQAYTRELGWREFSHHLIHHFPDTPERNLNRQFDAFPWAREDADAIARWQRGETGVPIIDAGMRQLWQSGWMHNRVRMLVASFLTKNLRQHWLHGARWFWDTLVDADLANNTQGWQWTAGCGADAAPYFRIFNPVTQGERFDPDGDYVRRWVPELKDVAAAQIHQPWKAAGLAARTGYPAPLVDPGASREAALNAYRTLRQTAAQTASRGT